MNTNKFIGTGVALVTPFNDDLSVDYLSLEKLVEYVINGGVDYLVVNGTTAESPTLNDIEISNILQCVIKVNNKRKPIVLGIGGNDTANIIETIKQTNFSGVDAILSVSPYYSKPTQEGIFQHYKTIGQYSPVPIIIYNIPGRTGSNVTAETTTRLAKSIPNIIGTKEASGNINQMMQIINTKPNNFLVISGDDSFALPLIAVGGHGVISVAANAFPTEVSALVRYALQGNFIKAQQIHYKLLNIFEWLFVDGNPPGIKACLSIKNIIKNTLRLPVVPVSQNTYKKLEELINQLN